MKFQKLIPLLILLFLPLAFLAAQDDVYATLDYFDGMNIMVAVPGDTPDANVTVLGYNDLQFGDVIPVGSTISTQDGVVELTLVPNGSVIKLAPGTEFKINDLSANRNQGSNDFTLASGRVRTVAAKLSGSGTMRIRSGNALCGVRGTDFTFDSAGQLYVEEGNVAFGKGGSGFDFGNVAETIQLAAGQFGDVTSDIFQAASFDPQQFAEQFADLTSFNTADVNNVPKDPQPEDQPQDNETSDGQQDTGTAAGTDTGDNQDQEAQLPDTIPEDSIIMDALGWMGMEIGSITIDGNTYSKAVFQPEFSLGKLRTQLYLPIIYTSNFLDPADWYKPNGNNEWSFGTDQPAGDYMAIVGDALTDLVLKFKYLEWGDSRDPFFFQLGNVSSMTLGHGILIRGYANDADFPSVRRIGLNMGVTTSSMKIQGLVNDLSDPFLYGLRVQFGTKFGVGLSAAADLNPWKVYEGVNTANLTTAQLNALTVKPAFLNGAIDLDFPIVESDLLGVVLFSDVAALLPYLADANTSLGLSQGFQWDAIVTGNGLKNFGVEAGAFGNVTFINYRVQFQYYNGTFIPGFYSQPYDRIRGDRATQVVEYLQNPDGAAYNNYTMGIYGEGGFNLFKDRMSLNMGYLWPWTIEADGSINSSANDYFKLGFAVDKELLKFLPWEMEASLNYDRVNFRNVFTDPAVKLFDESATLKGEAVVGITPGIKLAFTVSTNVLRDANGDIVYENGKPVIGPSIGLETRIGN